MKTRMTLQLLDEKFHDFLLATPHFNRSDLDTSTCLSLMDVERSKSCRRSKKIMSKAVVADESFLLFCDIGDQLSCKSFL